MWLVNALYSITLLSLVYTVIEFRIELYGAYMNDISVVAVRTWVQVKNRTPCSLVRWYLQCSASRKRILWYLGLKSVRLLITDFAKSWEIGWMILHHGERKWRISLSVILTPSIEDIECLNCNNRNHKSSIFIMKWRTNTPIYFDGRVLHVCAAKQCFYNNRVFANEKGCKRKPNLQMYLLSVLSVIHNWNVWCKEKSEWQRVGGRER